MDWNLKAPSWDLVDVDKATTLQQNIETMEEQNRFGVYRMKGEFSVDLKLGQVGNSGTESALAKSKDARVGAGGVAKMASSPSGPSKRARAIHNTTLVSCLVDGCNSDLSNCRDYHRRHKVCELHSKTPEVTIGGLKQRFCQQCSRFHSLEQFDERKRSCRKRLDGHNRRRRKPQPEPLTRPGSFLSNYQGTQLLPFSSPHAYPSTATWSGGFVTSSADQQLHLVDKQDLFLGSSHKEGKQVAFQTPFPSSASVCHTLLRTSPLSETYGARSKMLCENLTNSVHEHDSPCALSLLSSSSSQTHTPGDALNQMVQPLESVERVLLPNGSDHCSSIYSFGSDGPQCNLAPQLFPFQWE